MRRYRRRMSPWTRCSGLSKAWAPRFSGKGLYVKISGGTVYVSGPPRYTGLVRDVATGLGNVNRAVTDGIEVFRLKQAWAYDTTYTANGSQVTIPGVATILQNLLPSYVGGSYTGATPISQSVPSAMPKLTQTSVQGSQNYPTGPAHPAATSTSTNNTGTSLLGQATASTNALSGAMGTTPLPPFSPTQNDQQSPTVTYDVRENAVIVHDNKDRLKSYETLIADLDRPVKIIQINASIVDVNTNFSLQYGNQFLFNNKSVLTGLTAPGSIPPGSNSAGSVSDLVSSAALTTGRQPVEFRGDCRSGRSSSIPASSFLAASSCCSRTALPTSYRSLRSSPSIICRRSSSARKPFTSRFPAPIPRTCTT